MEILVLLAGLTRLPQDPLWHQSILIPYFQELALWLKDLLPPEVADKFQFLNADLPVLPIPENTVPQVPVPPVAGQ
jgi:uncharacterized membrane protein required for colicin V production